MREEEVEREKKPNGKKKAPLNSWMPRRLDAPPP